MCEELGKAAPEDQTLDVTVTDLQPVSVRASRLALAGALRTLVINAATLGGAPA